MDNSPVALETSQTPLLQGPESRTLSLVAQPRFRETCVLRGREAVLSRMGLLNDLCAGTGQEGAVRWLDFQMRTLTERKKIPTLVLVGADAQNAAAGDLQGAVIVYEYKVAGCGTGVFSADDSAGQRAVLAAKHLRAQVAKAACEGLIALGARAVILSYENESEYDRWHGDGDLWEMAARMRHVPLYLPLGATFAATLAGLGRHTRRNLRYYRRRTESETGSVFVPQAEIGRDEFLRINRNSINPVPAAMAHWRYDEFAGRQDMLFAGVRARDGRWLSLIGGRRHRGVTEIDWQMNLAGLARLSLSTVMRCCLLEHEAGRGTRTLVFNGGTPHSMRHSFVPVEVVDVLALRHSLGGRVLRALAPWALPQANFLGDALRDPEMKWVEE